MLTPRKPSEIEIWLAESWPITSIKVDYDQTGTDTAETFVTVEGRAGKKRFAWKNIEKFLSVGVSYNSAAKVHDRIERDVAAWRLYEKDNAAELAEFERLKMKFGG